jgi:hypothetical protein
VVAVVEKVLLCFIFQAGDKSKMPSWHEIRYASLLRHCFNSTLIEVVAGFPSFARGLVLPFFSRP